jgi:hypothetical protein
MKRNRVIIGGLIAALAVALLCGIVVWPFDIVTGRVGQLASLEVAGERFHIVQFWGADFYTDQLEHTTAEGIITRHEIDGDDMKRWSCHVKVIEPERKLVITFPGDSRYFEYHWDTRRLTKNGNEAAWF